MLQRFNMPTHTIPMLLKKPRRTTADLHQDILGTRNSGLGYLAKHTQPVLYDGNTLLDPTHTLVSVWDSDDVLVHQEKDDTIRHLHAEKDILGLLNVGSTESSFETKALETEIAQLKEGLTSLKIQNDGYKVTDANLNKCYQELSKANTHLRTTSLEKIAIQKA
nr:hypothetical protein [Tanacetum cinerariifolium]